MHWLHLPGKNVRPLRIVWRCDLMTTGRNLLRRLSPFCSIRRTASAPSSHSVGRPVTHALYPRILDALGLVAALKELTHQVSRHSSLKVSCSSHGTARALSKEIGVALYRCCQEAINNAIRYSDASELSLQIRFTRTDV